MKLTLTILLVSVIVVAILKLIIKRDGSEDTDGGGDATAQSMQKPIAPLSRRPVPSITNNGHSQHLIDISQDTWVRFAERHQLWVGPLSFNYRNGGDNISVSGIPPIVYFHSNNTNHSFVRSASLHEYVHLVQQAYGAESHLTLHGDENEDWHFKGPRWWSEGSADWIACVYSQSQGIDMEWSFEEITRAWSTYISAVQRCNYFSNGTKVTIRHTLSPNLTMNPTWAAVDECDLYYSHVYRGGLCAVDFAMGSDRTPNGLERIIRMIKSVAEEDDWEQAFLRAFAFENMNAFYDKFDAQIGV